MTQLVPQQESALNKLMRLDPLEITDDDIVAACKELRESRSKFLIEEQKPKRSEKRDAPTKLNLTDLGL